jgi:cellulose biosynthesis protein BcsQ
MWIRGGYMSEDKNLKYYLKTIKEVSVIKNIPETTIREWLDSADVKLDKQKNDSGVLSVDMRQLERLETKVLTVYNKKGGAAKTAIAKIQTNFYSSLKQKILIVDFDSQGSITKHFLGRNYVYNLNKLNSEELDPILPTFDDEDRKYLTERYRLLDSEYILNKALTEDEEEIIVAILTEKNFDVPFYETSYDFFINPKKQLSKIVRKVSDYIEILPASENFDYFDKIKLTEFQDYIDPLRKLFSKYSIVIIDCPPALNMFSQLGLMLSDYIIVPFMPTADIYQGTIDMFKGMLKIIPYCNYLKDWRILCTNVTKQNIRSQRYFIDAVIKNAGDKVFKNFIPKYAKIESMSIEKVNIFEQYKDSPQIIETIDAMNELDEFIYLEDLNKQLGITGE